MFIFIYIHPSACCLSVSTLGQQYMHIDTSRPTCSDSSRALGARRQLRTGVHCGNQAARWVSARSKAHLDCRLVGQGKERWTRVTWCAAASRTAAKACDVVARETSEQQQMGRTRRPLSALGRLLHPCLSPNYRVIPRDNYTPATCLVIATATAQLTC